MMDKWDQVLLFPLSALHIHNRNISEMCKNPIARDAVVHCTYQSEQGPSSQVMGNVAVGWNALLPFSCFWDKVKMISSEYNDDKCSVHNALAIISILFTEIQGEYSICSQWVPRDKHEARDKETDRNRHACMHLNPHAHTHTNIFRMWNRLGVVLW